jgi:hypothetical protein
MNVRAIAARVYGGHVQRERLDELHALLAVARANGYATMTMSAFADRVAAGSHESGERILLLRHDIDSDPPRARRMSEIERSLGMVGSFFFRRSTWDVGLMRELVAAGCEVGYHYEELATLIKQQGAATAVAARVLLDPARARLRSTLASLRADTGFRLDVLAAHGDFANRAVGVSSREMLDDASTRAELAVRLEAYDVEPHVSTRVSDSIKSPRLVAPAPARGDRARRFGRRDPAAPARLGSGADRQCPRRPAAACVRASPTACAGAGRRRHYGRDVEHGGAGRSRARAPSRGAVSRPSPGTAPRAAAAARARAGRRRGDAPQPQLTPDIQRLTHDQALPLSCSCG